MQLITGRKMLPPRILLYGPHGVGKTTWGAGAPSPVLVQTEDGLGNLDVPRFPLCSDYEQVCSALKELATEDHDRKTLVLDSLDHLEPLVWAETCRREKNKPSIESFGYGKGYVEASTEWRSILDLLSAIRNRGMSVVLLAHAEIKAFNDPSSEPYDRYQIKLHKIASAIVQEWVDAIFFATYLRDVIQADGKKTRAIGNGERVCYTEERPTHVAKNRWSLPYELPLDWASFIKAYKAATKGE
jgi:hypothetical protein